MSKFVDLSGRTFERLFVLRQAKDRLHGDIQYHCRCRCGADVVVMGYMMTCGKTRSCGCLQREGASLRFTTHGRKHTPEYKIWEAMKYRCANPHATSFRYYGARGISVCKRWQNFIHFFQDMGPRPTKQHSLERLDNEKGYSPNNVIWGTPKQQSNNQRRNVRFPFKKETKTATQWAQLYNLKVGTVLWRWRHGWSPVRILKTPVQEKYWHTKKKAQHHVPSSTLNVSL